MTIPDLIGPKSKLIALGIATALIVAVVGVEQWRISNLNDTIEKKDAAISRLTGDLAVSEANIVTLKVSIDRQNNAIQTLQTQKATLDAKVRASALEARRMRQETISTDGWGVDGMNNFFKELFK